MPKILLGIALAALLGAAALAFLAKGNAEKLQGILATTKQDLAMTRGKLKKTENDLQTRTEELAAANAKIEEKDKEIANLKGQMDDLNKKIADAAAAMEAKTAAMDALQKEFDEYKKLKEGGTTPVVGGVELESPIVTALKGDLVKAQAEAAESKALVDSLTAKKKELEDKMVALEQYKKRKETETMRIGVGGRILAVNPGWNFVVISIGDKEGAAMNATMLVVRDGTPIGKVRVTTVEPNSSIADIIPGTLGKGVTIQPGDRVIFEGRTPAVGVAPAAGVRGAATAPLR
jgi:archaellum component FlaG (FlaF/FlaG flagellin family)